MHTGHDVWKHNAMRNSKINTENNMEKCSIGMKIMYNKMLYFIY